MSRSTTAECLAKPLVLYHEAMACLAEGDLQLSREKAEDGLQALSTTVTTSSPSSSSSFPLSLCPQTQTSAHTLFANMMVLLSNVYSAAGSFDEAERLLATCAGYIVEHISPTDVRLATIAYNRAVLRLEVARLSPLCFSRSTAPSLTSSSASVSSSSVEEGVREALTVLLPEAEWLLRDVLGVQRLLLADVWHSKGVCHYLFNEYVSALECFHRSLELRVRYDDEAGVTQLKLALTLEHVAQIYRLQRAHLPEALHLLDVVVLTRRQLLGPHHPLYGAALVEEGVLAAELGKKKKAIAALTRACEVAERAYDADDGRRIEVEQWLHHVKSMP